MSKKTLLVIVPDRLSDLPAKGEVTERYYNPGDLFDEVHIVTVNDDAVDPAAIQKTVGRAKLVLHNMAPLQTIFLTTLAWRPVLLNLWARQLVDLARRIKPQLIRCHGAQANAYFAYCIKRDLGIPYLVSLHINPDEDIRGRAKGARELMLSRASQSVERIGLQNADLVMPVYKPIIPYLERLGVQRYEVCYNVLNPTSLRKKDSYACGAPVRIISVGRQIAEKNPDNLMRAVARIGNAHLTIVGDGTHHQHLQDVAAAHGGEKRFTFYRSIANNELCAQLPGYDIFATHTEYWEISKSVLEPLLTGLPVLLNRRIGSPVPELTEDICHLVDNNVAAYKAGLEKLIGDDAYRAALGRRAFAHAQANWAPAATEAKFVSIYERYLSR